MVKTKEPQIRDEVLNQVQTFNTVGVQRHGKQQRLAGINRKSYEYSSRENTFLTLGWLIKVKTPLSNHQQKLLYQTTLICETGMVLVSKYLQSKKTQNKCQLKHYSSSPGAFKNDGNNSLLIWVLHQGYIHFVKIQQFCIYDMCIVLYVCYPVSLEKKKGLQLQS